jgi:hypothetical protein
VGTTHSLGNLIVSGNTITLNGDVNTKSGVGVDSKAEFTLASAGTINLSRTDFFTSPLTLVGSSGSDTLNGLNAASTWDIAAGTIKNTAATKLITYTGFENIVGGTSVDTFTINASTATTISGGDGNDIFNITATGISVDLLVGGTNANDNDSIVGSTNVNDWSVTATKGSGKLRSSLNDINFSGMETLTGGGVVDTLTAPNAQANTWVVTAAQDGTINALNFKNMETLNGGDGVDTFTTSEVFTGTLNGKAGSDIFNVNHNISGGVNGESGSDIFNVNAAGLTLNLVGGNTDASGSTDVINAASSVTNTWQLTGTQAGIITNTASVTFSDMESLNGGGVTAADKLIANVGINNWILTDKNRGSLNGLAFSNMKNLSGNSDVDTFTFNRDFAFDGSQIIDAVGMGNIVDFSPIAKTVLITLDGSGLFNSVKNASTVQGNTTNSILTVTSDTETTWAINTANSGAVRNGAQSINFINFSALNGSAANNIFNLTSTFNGTINGGSTTNILSNATANTTWTLVGANAGSLSISGVTTNFTKIQTVRGSGADKLIGSDQTNNWNITGANLGTLGALNFSGMKNITGGTGVDTFTIETLGFIEGTVTGGTGVVAANEADTLSIGALEPHNNIWSLTNANEGSLTDNLNTPNYGVTHFVGVEKLVGGNGNDTFIFSDTGSIVSANGGEGSDTANYAASTSEVSVTLGASLVNGVSGIESFIGSSVANVNSILKTVVALPATVTKWTITDNNKGEVKIGTDDAISFNNFKKLVGSIGIDKFDFSTDNKASITENISGGGGLADEIIAPDLATTWNINNVTNGVNSFNYGPTTTTKFDGMEMLTGSAANIDKYFFTGATTGTYTLAAKDATGVVDVLNLEAVTAANINLTVGNAGNTGLTISGIEDIKLNNATNNTLTGYSEGSNWIIDKENGGTVTSVLSLSQFLSFSGFKNLNGATNGADTFTFSAAGNIKGTIDGGGATGNQITGRSDNSDWTITDIDNGKINVHGGIEYAHDFKNIQTLQGGAGGNTFTLNSGVTFKGNINGAEGVDKLNVSSVIQDISVGVGAAAIADYKILNIESVVANPDAARANTLIADNTVNTWTIDGNNKGTVNALSFSGFANVTGNAAVDTFTFSDGAMISGVVDGGTSLGGNSVKDILKLTALTTGITVELGNTNTSNLNVNNIENITATEATETASTPAKINHLVGSNVASLWLIDGANSGSVAPTSTVLPVAAPLLETIIKFNGFSQLTGGTQNDNFEISKTWVGAIDGGDGTDFIDYSKSTNNISVVRVMAV